MLGVGGINLYIYTYINTHVYIYMHDATHVYTYMCCMHRYCIHNHHMHSCIQRCAAWVRCMCGVDIDVVCAGACRCEVTDRCGWIHIAGGIVQYG